MPPPAPTRFRKCAKWEEGFANWPSARGTISLSPEVEARKSPSKLNERSGNVYESKGSLWKTYRRGGNVIENKGTYRFNAGMLFKAKGLNADTARSCWCVPWEQSASPALLTREQALASQAGLHQRPMPPGKHRGFPPTVEYSGTRATCRNVMRHQGPYNIQ